MTKHLQILCELLDKADIDYTIVADNQITIEAVTLELEHANPQLATQKDLAEGLWEDDGYIHITENERNMFSIAIVKEVRYDD